MGNGSSCSRLLNCVVSNREPEEVPAPVPEQTNGDNNPVRSNERKWYDFCLFTDSEESSSNMQEHSGEEQSGVEQSGVEHSGVQHSGVAHRGLEHSGVEHSGVEHSGVVSSTLEVRQEIEGEGQDEQETRQTGKPNEGIPLEKKEETKQFRTEQEVQNSRQDCDIVMQNTSFNKNTEHTRSMENIKLYITNEKVRYPLVVEESSTNKNGKLRRNRSLEEQVGKPSTKSSNVIAMCKSQDSSMEDFSSFPDDSQCTSPSSVPLGEYSYSAALHDLNVKTVLQDLDSAAAQVDSDSAERTGQLSSGLSSMHSEYDSSYSKEKDCYNVASSNITNRTAFSASPYVSSLGELSPLSGNLNADSSRGTEGAMQHQPPGEINTGSLRGAKKSILKTNKFKSVDDEVREMQTKKRQKNSKLEDQIPSHLSAKRPFGSSDNVNQNVQQTNNLGPNVQENMEQQSILILIEDKGKTKKPVALKKIPWLNYPKHIDPNNPNPHNFIIREEPRWQRQNSSNSTPQSRSHSDKEMLRRMNNNKEWRESWKKLVKLPRRRLHLSWQKYKASRTRQPEQPWYIAPPILWARSAQPQTAAGFYRSADEEFRNRQFRSVANELTRERNLEYTKSTKKKKVANFFSEIHGYFHPYVSKTETFGYSNHSARHVRFDLPEDESDSAIPDSITSNRTNNSESIYSIPSLSRADGEPAAQGQAADTDVCQPSTCTQESTLSTPKEPTDVNISRPGSARQSADMDMSRPGTSREGNEADTFFLRPTIRLSQTTSQSDSTDTSSSSLDIEKQRQSLYAMYGSYEDDDDEFYYPDDENPDGFGNVSI